MLNLLKKYSYLALGIGTMLAFLIFFFSIKGDQPQNKVSQLQHRFSKEEAKLKTFIKEKQAVIQDTWSFEDWNEQLLHAPYHVHVYRNDSLVYWNTNEMPVHQFADIHFPAEGLVKLQNGWYYTKSAHLKNSTLVASFLVKSEYPYENEHLTNAFAVDMNFPFKGTIELEKVSGAEINATDGAFLFSFLDEKNQAFSTRDSIALTLLLIAAICFFLLALQKSLNRISFRYSWLFIPLIIGLRLLSLHYDWLNFLNRAVTFQPELYAQSDWFPTFGDYLINCVISLFVFYFASQWIYNFKRTKLAPWVGFAGIIFGFLIWHFIVGLMEGLIENSSIPLLINRIFSLNFFSVLSLISIGFLFFSFFRLTRSSLRLLMSSGIAPKTMTLVVSLLAIAYFLYEWVFGLQMFLAAGLPLLYYAVAIYHVQLQTPRFSTQLAIIYLLLVSASTSIQFTELSHHKERETRELYANQLAADKDVLIELEYGNLSEKIKSDPYLAKFTILDRQMNLSDFEDAMERRFFRGIWDKYELSFNLFDTLGIPLVADESQNFTFAEINELIAQHTTASEGSQFLYFVDDYADQINYIIRQPLEENGKPINAVFYCTLKSKKIPEEIGFPRLLISSNTSVLKTLESYSIARYNDGRLVTKYGDYNYPTKGEIVRKWPTKDQFADVNGFSHYILKKSDGDLIVLSQQLDGWFDQSTSFSFVFCFYGLLLFPAVMTINRNSKRKYSNNVMTLAVKIQLVLLGLVFISLLAFSWGSTIFVNNQYENYSQQLTREKLNSVSIDLKSKLGAKKVIDINEDGNYMEYLLRRFSKIFVTDINLYDTKGYLLASSRPKIYNTGLQSEQINPLAFESFAGQHKSEFIHQEQIGKLKFISAYIPFYNSASELLGFINLQHFGQQEEYENQIQQFLVAIVNVFMLLLMLSSIFSIFISSWVIAPLNLLQESFSKIKFGKTNQRIDYDKEDEIGVLVRDYNNKLEELEFAAQQIAKNEREMAWREMAKQVAHEIKNPLTPMKLSIQQLQRIFDPNDPDSKEKIDRVSRSLIEQIDALTTIANEFSTFAKMPQPNEVEIDLVFLIASVVEVFQHEDEIEIVFQSNVEACSIRGDKDQLLRVFNNLIKNAIQAIPEATKGSIRIDLERKENIQITISDNGSGISEEEQKRIFDPYFTTKSTGTGLGLAMVRQIIENHKGLIYFSSVQGEGTTFTIELPLS